MGNVDIVIFLLDMSNPDPVSENFIADKVQKKQGNVILVLNKIDLVDKSRLLTVIDKWSKIYPFKALIPVSAKHGIQVEDLCRAIEALLPQGPPFFPEDAVTDVPQRFIAAEMIREKVFRLTGQEIPYSTAVTIDSFNVKKKGAFVKISATIHVERASQKGIIIGRGGNKIKTIGESARKDIERMVGGKVFLSLFVRVQKDWSRDTKALRKFGY
jgi:GTP-binding protein Era